MSGVIEKIERKRHAAETASVALSAASTIARMDPHARADLIAFLSAYNEAQQVADQEEMDYLIEAIVEVFDPQSNCDSPDLDVWYSRAADEARGEAAQLRQETDEFFARYHTLKAKSGLDTIRAVANAAGLSCTTVQAIEQQAAKPQFRTLMKLAKAFGVQIADLTGRTEHAETE